jgi:membrane protein
MEITMNRAAFAPRALVGMAKESAAAWVDDFAPSMGAAIAYYTAFSIAPLLIILIAMLGFFLGEKAASGQIYVELGGLLGDDGARAVEGMVQSASNFGQGIIASIIGIALLVVGATTVFAELQTDLDRIWKAPAAKKSEGLWGIIRGRVLSLGLVITIGFLLLVSLTVSAALAALGKWWGGAFGHFEWLLHVIDFALSFTVITVLFALMYKLLPRVKIAWPDVWIGAAVTSLLFVVGKVLVGLYLGKSSVVSSFGAAGSLAVLLIWVYYSAQIFLLGAEFTWVYAHRFGSRRDKDQPATAKQSLATVERPAGEAMPADTLGPAEESLPKLWPRHGISAFPTFARSPPAPRVAIAGPMIPAQQPGWRVKRNSVLVTGGALLIGIALGELMNLRDRKPRRVQTLLHELPKLARAGRLSKFRTSSWRILRRFP